MLSENVRAPNYDLAYVDYCRGMKYKDIAEKYGVTINTVKSWKTRYKWSKDGTKSVHTKKQKVCTQKEKKKKAAEREVDGVIENPELTDKQRLFCVCYIRSFNATKAYQKAYGCSYENAMQNGSRMLRNDKVKTEILRLKQERLNREFLSESDIFQKYMDIAFADITDYVEFGTEEVPVVSAQGLVKIEDPKTGKKKPLTQIENTIRFRKSTEVDGTLISEVKHGRNGSSIKLADRMRALDWLSEHMDMGTEEQRARIAQIRAQTDKLTGNNQEIEDLNDIEGEIYGSK